MNYTHTPALDEIEELIAFLPKLYAEGFKPVKVWHGGERFSDGHWEAMIESGTICSLLESLVNLVSLM